MMGASEDKVRYGSEFSGTGPIGGSDRNDVVANLAKGAKVGERILGWENARVVVAARLWLGKGRAGVAWRGGYGAWSRVAACRLVSGGHVTLLVVDPEGVAAEVYGELDGDEWGPLVDLG
ncbi:hypothetical protein TorRG33x02_020510 [Trema orientale]|uniref:Uncharacterized protein n=1 Tax=Trema orientale TaxID=63057 RepID=A0A2P5FWX7_TREOI|nr:hypothetical protein TorRG33x02_020510 [Trema orientale]